jgi:hypothetical protein
LFKNADNFFFNFHFMLFDFKIPLSISAFTTGNNALKGILLCREMSI